MITSIHDSELVPLLTSGAVGVLPTDTIYGIVAPAGNAAAVARLYELKHREQKPGTVIAASAEQLVALGVDPLYIKQVADLWPSPLSVEMLVGDNLAHLHQGTGHCAFRVVADEAVRTLLEQTGPLLTSSANLPGETPSANIEEAQEYFGEGVDFYVDGGVIAGRAPSTVARLTENGKLELRRQGAVVIPSSRRY